MSDLKAKMHKNRLRLGLHVSQPPLSDGAYSATPQSPIAEFKGPTFKGTGGKLNTRGVAEYSDFGPIERYISETVRPCDRNCV